MKKAIVSILFLASAFGQSPMVRGTLGSGYVLLGKLASANMNVTTDQSITITIPGGASKYCIREIDAVNASISLTTALGGIYTAASKGGTAIVAATQAYSTMTAATVVLPLTLAVSNVTATQTTYYFSLTTAQGSAATADIYVFGTPMP